MAYSQGWTGRLLGNRNPADAAQQQQLNDLSGAMVRNGATIGTTGGLNYGGQNPVPGVAYAQSGVPQIAVDGSGFAPGMTAGPSSQQVSGNAVPVPNPNATLQPPPPVTNPVTPPPGGAPPMRGTPAGPNSMPTVPGFDPNASYETNLAQYNKNFATSDNPAWLAALAPQQQAWMAAHPGQGNNPTGTQYGNRSGTPVAAPPAHTTAAPPPPPPGAPLYQNVGGFQQPTAAGYAYDAAQQAATLPQTQQFSSDPARAAAQKALYESYAKMQGFG